MVLSYSSCTHLYELNDINRLPVVQLLLLHNILNIEVIHVCINAIQEKLHTVTLSAERGISSNFPH